MANEGIDERVKRIVASALCCAPDRVVPQARFVQDLEADSLGIVETILAIEKEFDIKIPDDEVDRLLTVADAARYIRARLG